MFAHLQWISLKWVSLDVFDCCTHFVFNRNEFFMFIFYNVRILFYAWGRIDPFTSFVINSLHEHLRMYIDFQTAHELIIFSTFARSTFTHILNNTLIYVIYCKNLCFKRIFRFILGEPLQNDYISEETHHVTLLFLWNIKSQ